MSSPVLLVLALVACENDVPDVPRAGTGVAPAVTALMPIPLDMLGPNGPEQANATLAVSRRGHIAFTTGFDSAGHLVTLVDSTGRVLARVGTKGAGPGEFRMIIRLFVHDSTLYVYDGYHLSEFDFDGHHRRSRSVPPDVMLWHLRGDSIDARIIVDLRRAMALRRLSLRTLRGRELLSAQSPVLLDLTRSPTDSTRYLPYTYAPKGAGFVLGNGSSHRMVAFDAAGVPLRPSMAFFGRDLPAQRLSGAALEREVGRLLAAARRPFRLPDGTERINPVSKEQMEKQAGAAIPYFSWLRGGLQSDQWGRTLAIVPGRKDPFSRCSVARRPIPMSRSSFVCIGSGVLRDTSLHRGVSRTDPSPDSTMRRLIALTILSTAVACSDATAPLAVNQDLLDDGGLQWADLGRVCASAEPAVPLTAEQRASLPGPSPTSDYVLADLTREVTGGFGGIMRPDGVWTMYLVNPALREQATTELLALDAIPEAPQVVLTGRWTFAEMVDWQQYIFVHAGFPAGMVYADVQEARNRLEFGVLDETARIELEAELAALGAPCYLVAIGISSPIQSR